MAERAVSTALNYVLLLGILSILLSVIVVGATDYVEQQREDTVRSELTVQGNRLAADLATIDSLAATADTVRVRASLAEQVGRSNYRLRITEASPDDTYRLTLVSTDPGVGVTVQVRTSRSIETGTYSGGDLWLSYDPATDTLEVTDD